MFNAYTLIVGEDGSTADSFYLWVLLQHILQQMLQVLHFICRLCFIHQALLDALPFKSPLHQRHLHTLTHHLHHFCTYCLVHPAIFLFTFFRLKVSNTYQIMSMDYALHYIENTVFTSTY